MKIVHIFLGADLRGAHNYFRILSASSGHNVNELKTGEAIIAINKAKDKLKAYSYNGALTYIRFDDKKRGIDLNAIDELARAFRPDGTLDYTKALKESFSKRLTVKQYKKLTVL